MRKLAMKYASSFKDKITPSPNDFTTVLCVYKFLLPLHVSSSPEIRAREYTDRVAMEERLMEIFILTILLLYILVGCWMEDMELVAGGAIGFVLVLAFRR